MPEQTQYKLITADARFNCFRKQRLFVCQLTIISLDDPSV